jgi:hypothetical protein
MIELGKALLGLGLLLVVIGSVLFLAGRLGLPFWPLAGRHSLQG